METTNGDSDMPRVTGYAIMVKFKAPSEKEAQEILLAGLATQGIEQAEIIQSSTCYEVTQEEYEDEPLGALKSRPMKPFTVGFEEDPPKKE